MDIPWDLFPHPLKAIDLFLLSMIVLVKWTEAYEIPNQETKTIFSMFVNEFICRFGTY